MKDLSLHLLDIVQNSISAKAGKIFIGLKTHEAMLILTVEDNGCGMDDGFLKSVTNPFVTTRTTRKVGLGIPLLKQSSELAGGKLTIHSEKGKGTSITASFQIDNIDRIPMGDMGNTIVSLIGANPDVELYLLLEHGNERTFELSTEEVKSRIGNIPVNHRDVLDWIKQYIEEGLQNVFGGVLNEITG